MPNVINFEIWENFFYFFHFFVQFLSNEKIGRNNDDDIYKDVDDHSITLMATVDYIASEKLY